MIDALQSVSKFSISCRMQMPESLQVFSSGLKRVHAFLMRLRGFDSKRIDKIFALWLHLRSNVQPHRGQEIWGVCHL